MTRADLEQWRELASKVADEAIRAAGLVDEVIKGIQAAAALGAEIDSIKRVDVILLQAPWVITSQIMGGLIKDSQEVRLCGLPVCGLKEFGLVGAAAGIKFFETVRDCWSHCLRDDARLLLPEEVVDTIRRSPRSETRKGTNEISRQSPDIQPIAD